MESSHKTEQTENINNVSSPDGQNMKLTQGTALQTAGVREKSEEREKAARQESGWGALAAAPPCLAAFSSVLWPLTAPVMWLNEEISGAELELKQMEILSGFCHLFCTCH